MDPKRLIILSGLAMVLALSTQVAMAQDLPVDPGVSASGQPALKAPKPLQIQTR
jgi:hypothetical protein